MKVALTGHSKGIGAALARTLTDQGHVVVGYDLTNSYDITQPGVIKTIVEMSSDCDVFINNAYVDVAQTKLFNAIISAWQYTDKMIINISSKMVFRSDIVENKHVIYKRNKLDQNKIVRSRINYTTPHILNIISGFVDTDLTIPWGDSDKMNPDDFAQLVIHLISLRDKIQVQEIIIDAVPTQESNTNAS